MRSLRLHTVAIVVFSAILMAYCSGTETPPPGTDGGTGTDGGVECRESNECLVGDCLDNKCVSCQDVPCTGTDTCGMDGKCSHCTGAGCATDGGSGGSCTTRRQCAENQVCHRVAGTDAGVCSAPTDGGCSGTSNECVAGRICRFDSCIAGCEANADCKHADAGSHCNTTTTICGPCSPTDCVSGEVCMNAWCVTPPSCSGSRTPCGDLACLSSGKCGYCAGSDCGNGSTCTNGKCVSTSGCTSSDQCRASYSAGWWCNAQNQCQAGCLPAGTCTAADCCAGGQSCNTTTHQCEGCNNCNNACTGTGEYCDTTTCSCVTQGDGGFLGDGGLFNMCNPDCTCTPGTPICLVGDCTILDGGGAGCDLMSGNLCFCLPF